MLLRHHSAVVPFARSSSLCRIDCCVSAKEEEGNCGRKRVIPVHQTRTQDVSSRMSLRRYLVQLAVGPKSSLRLLRLLRRHVDPQTTLEQRQSQKTLWQLRLRHCFLLQQHQRLLTSCSSGYESGERLFRNDKHHAQLLKLILPGVALNLLSDEIIENKFPPTFELVRFLFGYRFHCRACPVNWGISARQERKYLPFRKLQPLSELRFLHSHSLPFVIWKWFIQKRVVPRFFSTLQPSVSCGELLPRNK